MKMKLPNLPKFRWLQARTKRLARPKPPTRYQATAARRGAAPALDDYDDEEQPVTKLSTAFFVVLILHAVFIGGIYAFSSIKAHRHAREAAAEEKADTSASAAATTLPESAALSAAPSATAARPLLSGGVAPPAAPHILHARGGESLGKFAAQHGINAIDLAEANNLSQATILKANQTLTIPAPRTPAVHPTATTDVKKSDFLTRKEDGAFLKATPAPSKPPITEGKSYTVAKGDTIYSIARKFSVTPDDLMKANKIEDSKKLQIAQILKVPAKKSE